MGSRTRFVLSAPVLQRAVAADARARPPEPADADALTTLMFDAYRGGIDDEGENLIDTRAVVQQLFDGDFGTMLWPLSEVVEGEGTLLAATLLTRWQQQPFVAFMLTAPTHRRQGLARAGLARAINRLAAAGEPRLRLVVTQGNTAAEALYESLGFVPEAQPPFTTA
jgi:RimJ/RimL family protein N-acetyltransferase